MKLWKSLGNGRLLAKTNARCWCCAHIRLGFVILCRVLCWLWTADCITNHGTGRSFLALALPRSVILPRHCLASCEPRLCSVGRAIKLPKTDWPSLKWFEATRMDSCLRVASTWHFWGADIKQSLDRLLKSHDFAKAIDQILASSYSHSRNQPKIMPVLTTITLTLLLSLAYLPPMLDLTRTKKQRNISTRLGWSTHTVQSEKQQNPLLEPWQPKIQWSVIVSMSSKA